jgi:hypothetical protein
MVIFFVKVHINPLAGPSLKEKRIICSCSRINREEIQDDRQNKAYITLYNNLRTGTLVFRVRTQIKSKDYDDSVLITEWSQTCSELGSILGTAREFIYLINK